MVPCNRLKESDDVIDLVGRLVTGAIVKEAQEFSKEGCASKSGTEIVLMRSGAKATVTHDQAPERGVLTWLAIAFCMNLFSHSRRKS